MLTGGDDQASDAENDSLGRAGHEKAILAARVRGPGQGPLIGRR